MGIALKEILELDCFSGATLHAGDLNLGKTIVSGITIVERPDIARWIKGGELLLTSFYSIETDVEAQKKLITDLAKNGAAGIIIKISDTYPALIGGVVQSAREIGFPLVEISSDVKYVDILYPVMEYLFNDQVVRLNYYKNCHVRFNKLSLTMKGIESIAKTLEELVKQPVLIFDNEMRILAYSKEEFSHLNIVEKKMRRMVYEGYPVYGMDIEFENQKETYHLTVEPIEVVGKVRAYLGVVEIGTPLRDLDFIAIESAANTLRLEILKETAVNESQLRYKGDLMDEIIHKRYVSAQDVYDRGAVLGWDLHRSYIIAAITIKSQSKQKSEKTEWLMQSRETVKSIIDRIAFHYVKDHISLIKGEEIVVFWPISSTTSQPYVYNEMKKFGAEVRENVKKRLGEVSVLMGIGGTAYTLESIGQNYLHAKDALQFGQRIYGNNETVVYEELGIYKILCSIQDRESLIDFVPENLKKLREYDSDKNNELIDTFEMYLKCNLNAVRTSEELFVHYKTVLYRLNRIKEITAIDLNDREKMLEVEMGLKILKLIS